MPAKDDDKFHRWTQHFVSIGVGGNPLFKIPAIMRFMGYLRRLIKQRTNRPRDDLITALVQAKEQDDRLTEDEILAMIFLLLSAGHETTVNLIAIASGVLALLEHPDQWEKLRNDPSLIALAIEELVRFTSPAETATERYPREDVTTAGATIPKGELVLAVSASANRDAARFDNPGVVDITRQNNKRLAFGQGIHYCVGAPLSRLEGQVAINTLIERIPNPRFRVSSDQLRWRRSCIVRGLAALPVSF